MEVSKQALRWTIKKRKSKFLFNKKIQINQMIKNGFRIIFDEWLIRRGEI